MDTPAKGDLGRRVSRRADHRWVAGVASGIADAAAVPVWVVRLAFVVATPFGGLGPVAYGFCWWLIPRRDLPESAAQRLARRFPQAPAWLGGGLLLLGVLLFVGQLGWIRAPVVVGLALVAIGVLLYVRDPGHDEWRAAPDLPAATMSEEAADLPPVAFPPAGWRHRERRRPSFLGPLTLGVGLIAIATGTLLDLAGAVSFELDDAAGVLLLVLGVGMVVGSVLGRARWLFLPVVVIAPLALATMVLHIDLDDGIGERVVTVRTLQEPVDERLAAGDLTIDLTSLEPGTAGLVRAHVGAGMLTLNVPEDLDVALSGEVGFGTVEHLYSRPSPSGYVYLRRSFGPDEARFDPPLAVDGRAGTGDLTIMVDVPIGGVRINNVQREEVR